MSTLESLTEAIKKGKRKDATAAVTSALAEGALPDTVLQALTTGMDGVGRRFKANDIFVPEVLVAARAMKESMAILEPILTAAGIRPESTVVIGTVKGDLHDIGKNLVAMMLKGANFSVVDLGTDVPPDRFISAVKEHGAQVIALSALLTTTMPAMRETLDAIRASGLHVRTMIGGAPITQEYADEIGACGYAADAASAVDIARTLVRSA